MTDNEAPFAKVDDSRRQMREPRLVLAWMAGRADRQTGARGRRTIFVYTSKELHTLYTHSHVVNIYYIYIIYICMYVYLFTYSYEHTRYSLNLLWSVFTSSFCLINKFSIRIIKLYVCVHMYLYVHVHMYVCFSFSILGRRLHVSLIYIEL